MEVFLEMITLGSRLSNVACFGGLLRLFFLCLPLLGCAPKETMKPPDHESSFLAYSHFVATDGEVLPIRSFLPPDRPLAIIVAVHGFNDYSRAFQTVGPYLRDRRIGMIAYDQRGFGISGGTGMWAGSDRYQNDLSQLVSSLRLRFPNVPIYLLGESMGAAIVITTLKAYPQLSVAGAILSAPAVWSRDTMPWYQRLVLEFAAATVPEMRLTGSGLRVQASDNIDMLRALGRDPWVIKATRVAAIQGLADLMDMAQAQAKDLAVPTLILYGGNDQIIPAEPVWKMAGQTLRKPNVRMAYYPEAYHLLLRDLDARIPLGDIVSWVLDFAKPLPSGCELQSESVANSEMALKGQPGCLSSHEDLGALRKDLR
jgi:acylglycerol lipase